MEYRFGLLEGRGWLTAVPEGPRVQCRAELSGVSRVTITAVKSGKSCNEATAHKLAQVLGPNIIKEEV